MVLEHLLVHYYTLLHTFSIILPALPFLIQAVQAAEPHKQVKGVACGTPFQAPEGLG